jgi:branched-chain amino acid aminotransferase
VRVYFIYNKIGIWKSDEPFPAVDQVMCSADRPERSGPIDLTVWPHGRHAAHPLVNVKVISWLHNAWTVEQAHQRGFEEALLLNERNEVAECTAANVFLVRGGQVVTPPLSSGCLPGVTREVLLEIAPQKGVPLGEATVTLNDLQAADEVFITSTTREVQPVRRIDDHRPPQAPGPVTERLAKVFSQYVSETINRC